MHINYSRKHKVIIFYLGGYMKKLILSLVIIAIAIFISAPVKADHQFGYNNYHYNNNFNYGGYNNRFHNPYGYNPRRGHRPYGGWHHNRRNNDLAGIIIGGIIINEIFRNNNRRGYNRNICRDVRRQSYDHYGNQVIYYERICN